ARGILPRESREDRCHFPGPVGRADLRRGLPLGLHLASLSGWAMRALITISRPRRAQQIPIDTEGVEIGTESGKRNWGRWGFGKLRPHRHLASLDCIRQLPAINHLLAFGTMAGARSPCAWLTSLVLELDRAICYCYLHPEGIAAASAQLL